MVRAYTYVHVILSLIGIATGFVALTGMVLGDYWPGWTHVFLATTTATSVTGFFFPFQGFKPSYVVGLISLVVLGLAYAALHHFALAGSWRWVYVVTATLAQYLNVFVLVVQMFQKIPSLNRLAPTQSEAPFKQAQLAVLAGHFILGTFAILRFHP